MIRFEPLNEQCVYTTFYALTQYIIMGFSLVVQPNLAHMFPLSLQ